jgi:AraC-like DNA-binding protein
LRELIEQVRGELAMKFVIDDAYSLTRISRMLGYSQSSAFTRWVQGRFCVPPSAWRKASQLKPPLKKSL